MNSVFAKIILILLSVSLLACSSYRHPDFVIRDSAYYDYSTERDGLSVVADPYVTQGKQEMLFNYDATKKGIYPVHLIFFNEGDETFSLKEASVRLIDNSGKEFMPLSHAEIEKLVSRSVLGRTALFGTVGTLIGTIAAPVTGLAGAIWGGVDTKKSNEYAKEIVSEKSFRTLTIEPGQTVHGFLFFNPAKDFEKGDKPAVLKESFRFQIANIQKGEEVLNFSIYIPSEFEERTQ